MWGDLGEPIRPTDGSVLLARWSHPGDERDGPMVISAGRLHTDRWWVHVWTPGDRDHQRDTEPRAGPLPHRADRGGHGKVLGLRVKINNMTINKIQ